ncbi:hypothetical protein K5Q02_11355 [Pseudomonas sp. MM211]|uniref:hypothetical protein n=1 Tax=Pseudomonas sp. MM211 TaxID=2866808 RepID=UPI001CEC5DF5|nr:hypothetical protein [Pseudomonas sp. MM211]UCJ18913.1 hypothetical protein K5Q02_11355 [Pseudomonas sp. MM211]
MALWQTTTLVFGSVSAGGQLEKDNPALRPCKLCGENKNLCNSHIIPKAFFRRIKDGDPQLYRVTVDSDPIARSSNGDEIQRLLCFECEQFFQRTYEDYGTELFINQKNICENEDFVFITRFQYEKYYLFIISILWRASVSTLKNFREIHSLISANKILNPCLRLQTLNISLKNNIRLDDFIKISATRIIDPQDNIPQSVIDGVMSGLSFGRGNSPEEGVHYYFMVDGYIILINLYPPNSPTLKNWHPKCAIKDRTYLKIPKIPYYEIKEVKEGMAALAQARAPEPKRGRGKQ